MNAIPINIDPNIAQLGPFLLTWHGIFTAVGVVAGVWLAWQLAPRFGLDRDEVLNVAMWGIVGGVVGARLVHVVDHWPFYSQNLLSIFRIYEGGLAIWGVVIFGPALGLGYAWRRGLPVGKLADIAAPGLLLGMAVGRIGDIINGEHHGAPAEGFPFAVVYVHPDTLGQIGQPVHLAVAYEMIWNLVIMGLILVLLGLGRGGTSRLPAAGMAFWLFVMLYSVGKFVVHFYRIDSPIWLAGLTQAQLVALAGGALSIWFFSFLWARQHRARIDALEDEPFDDDEPFEDEPDEEAARPARS